MDTSTKPTLFEARIYQPLILSFEKLTDLRMKRGVRYKHKPLIILLFLSKLGGADSSAEVADWVQFRFAQLKSLLKLDWHRSPHEVTWKRFLEKAIKAEEVEEVFSEFLRSLSEEAKELLNLDGKLVRGTKAPETDRQLHLLALQASDLNLTVEQIALTEAENEISGARRLFEKADLEQKIVSGDAIFAQKELSEKVVEKGGEYLWKLRANQGRMYELAKEHFEKMPDQYLDRASSLEKGHGRIDERAHSDQFPTVGPNRVSVFGASL